MTQHFMKGIFGPLKPVLGFFFVLFGWNQTLCAAPPFQVQVELTGGAHRMFREGIDQPVLDLVAWSTDTKAHEVATSFQIEDIWDRPLPAELPPVVLQVPEDGSKAHTALPLNFGIGYYAITVKFSDSSSKLVRTTDLGIVWPSYPGSRPNSFFASNSSLRRGEDLQLLETIGMKVQRTHFIPGVTAKRANWPKEMPAGKAAPLDFDSLDKEWNEIKAHGLWVLPVAGYSLGGAGVFDRTPLAERLGMYGPPNDDERFIHTWETVLQHYPELTTIEFWNEPWTFGWTWAATPEAYRQLQEGWCKMALAINPHYRLLAGSSVAFVRDEIEPFPDSWDGLLQGVTHHPYTQSVLQRTFRRGDVFRSIDEIRLTARDLGLPYAYLTEGGTAYRRPGSSNDDEPFNNLQNAQKLVQYYVAAALAGVFMGNAQWEIGYGPGWTKSNTAFGVLTHFLEDRVPLVDVWPRQELIWGGIFANRKFATPAIKSLARGSELAARWNVQVPPDRAEDNTKVAVMWGLTGASAEQLDTDGDLAILEASDLRAYNMVGQEILPSQGKLILPLNGSPIYLTTENLGVLEFRDRIESGAIRRVTPLNLYAFSLRKPGSSPQELSVRIENQINRHLQGTLVLGVTGSDETPSARFETQGGDLTEVEVPWPKVPVRSDNRYPITLTVHLDGDAGLEESFSPIARDQVISTARFEKRSIRLTGTLADWDGMVPVTIDSSWFRTTDDRTAYLLNPKAERKPVEDSSQRIVGQVYTAYDDDFVYLGAAVLEDRFHCSAGEQIVQPSGNLTTVLPYKQGWPDGLHFVTECGNVFQFSFGFRDRVPGIGRQVGDVWAWKGAFYDADYSYVANTSVEGDQLVRVWGPDTSRRNGYQTETVPGIGPVPGSTVKITRDDANKLTLYEIAIPRRQLVLFDPGSGRCRFGFIIYNSDHVAGGALAWSDVAGVFDYWQAAGSFPPTWRDHLACQTFFGIEP